MALPEGADCHTTTIALLLLFPIHAEIAPHGQKHTQAGELAGLESDLGGLAQEKVLTHHTLQLAPYMPDQTWMYHFSALFGKLDEKLLALLGACIVVFANLSL